MDSDVVEINCRCLYVMFDSLRLHLPNFDKCKCTERGDGLIVEFKIGGDNIRINLTDDFKENIDVGVIGSLMNRLSWFSDLCESAQTLFREDHPTAPMRKYRPGKMKEAELNGDKMMNREIGDKLARELGAVKYIEYSYKTGRRVKILLDEIAFAGIGKMKDDEKRSNKRKSCVVT